MRNFTRPSSRPMSFQVSLTCLYHSPSCSPALTSETALPNRHPLLDQGRRSQSKRQPPKHAAGRDRSLFLARWRRRRLGEPLLLARWRLGGPLLLARRGPSFFAYAYARGQVLLLKKKRICRSTRIFRYENRTNFAYLRIPKALNSLSLLLYAN